MNFLSASYLFPNFVNLVSQISVSGNLSLILFAIASLCLANSGKLPFIHQNKIKTRQNVSGIEAKSMNEIKSTLAFPESL